MPDTPSTTTGRPVAAGVPARPREIRRGRAGGIPNMTTRLSKMRPLTAVALSALLSVVGAACGGDDDDTSTSDEGGGGGSGGRTVEITAPEDGAEVAGPVEMELASSEEVGETDTGLPHFHVHYDGDAENYDLVFAEGAHTAEQDLEAGEHTVQLVLANADHSETDVTDEITITVGDGGSDSGGGGGGGDGGDTSTTDDPYGY